MNELEHSYDFVAEVGVGDDDAQKMPVSATMCNSSVSLTANGQTIHVPWREVAEWMRILALHTQQDG